MHAYIKKCSSSEVVVRCVSAVKDLKSCCLRRSRGCGSLCFEGPDADTGGLGYPRQLPAGP